jgi:hypothetical protein
MGRLMTNKAEEDIGFFIGRSGRAGDHYALSVRRGRARGRRKFDRYPKFIAQGLGNNPKMPGGV